MEDEKKENGQEGSESENDRSEEGDGKKDEGGKEPDYKALLEAERKRVQDLETEKRRISGALKEERLKNRQQDNKQQDEGDGADDEKKVENKDISTDHRAVVREELRSERLESVLGEIKNPDKRELVREYLKTRINPSGHTFDAIREDVELALLHIDRKSYFAEADRKARKKIAEESAFQREGSRFQSSESEDDEATKEEAEIAASVGMDPKKFKVLNKTLEQLRKK